MEAVGVLMHRTGAITTPPRAVDFIYGENIFETKTWDVLLSTK